MKSLPLLIAAGLFAGGCAETPMGPDAHRGAPPSAPAPAEASLVPVSGAAPLDAALLKPSTDVYQLGPGDQIDIEVMGTAGTAAVATVGPDGKIYYSILPGLDVWGLTLAQAQSRIASALNRYFRQEPVVSVSLHAAGSERVWILGRVANPGVFVLNGPTTVLDAIAESGGVASNSALAALAGSLGVSSVGSAGESADLSRAFLIRKGKVVPIDFQRLVREGDLSQNIYLQPDDFIFLPSARSPHVHVLGAVANPGSEPVHGSLTLVQAVALAGGSIEGACLTDVAILRGSVAHPEIGVVSVRDILHGKASDVQLEPGDIVYVPFTPYRTLERYANLILDTFARTVGVNEGAKAVSKNAVGVGISVSP